MDVEKEKNIKKNGTNGISKTIQVSWSDHVTCIDLSNRNITELEDNVNFPANLDQLNLSNNSFSSVPIAVLRLLNLRILNVSHNNIVYFDDTPNFLYSIEELNLASNKLVAPPSWVWFESPTRLRELNLNDNVNITSQLSADYLKQLLQCPVSIEVVKIINCNLKSQIELLKTFPKAKVIEIGTEELNHLKSNRINQIPCQGLEHCAFIERLKASYTHIYNVDTKINMYEALIEINLSHNHIRGLPNEFCNLKNLEVCILSSNCIMYLPDDIVEMEKLKCLRIDCNELCMLPENLSRMENLTVLDLYDNVLYEIPDCVLDLEELDLALNYLEEPDTDDYLVKKEKLRLNMAARENGKKVEVARSESEYSDSATDDEEFLNSIKDLSETGTTQAVSQNDDGNSSSEDWDSDDYWVPYQTKPKPPSQVHWIQFVEQKMREGNFCPMDAHIVPISEQVNYNKIINPKRFVEVPGQFDDYSGDDS